MCNSKLVGWKKKICSFSFHGIRDFFFVTNVWICFKNRKKQKRTSRKIGCLNLFFRERLCFVAVYVAVSLFVRCFGSGAVHVRNASGYFGAFVGNGNKKPLTFHALGTILFPARHSEFCGSQESRLSS